MPMLFAPASIVAGLQAMAIALGIIGAVQVASDAGLARRAFNAVAAAHDRFAASSHALLDAIPNTIVVSRPTVTTTVAVPFTLKVHRPASTLYVTARPTLIATAVASPPSSYLVPVTSPVVAEHARARSEVPAWTMWSVARLVLFNLAAHLLVFRQKVRLALLVDSLTLQFLARIARAPLATARGYLDRFTRLARRGVRAVLDVSNAYGIFSSAHVRLTCDRVH